MNEPMGLLSTDHVPLPPRPGWVGTTQIYRLDLRKGPPKRRAFDFVVRALPEPSASNGRKSRSLDIKIHRDAWIQIELSDSIDWHWAMANAVTTGSQTDHFFELQYETSSGWQSSPGNEFCRVVRFGAKHDMGGTLDTSYAFNLNIELEHDDGVVPITIDPDMRNPGTVPIIDQGS